MNERAENRKSCERQLSELQQRPVDNIHVSNGRVQGNVETPRSPKNEQLPTKIINRSLSTLDSSVFRTNLTSEPSIFAQEFQAFQRSMSQTRVLKLQLQGLQSLFDLAACLEDERDRVLERLQKLGLREDSFKILSISTTNVSFR